MASNWVSLKEGNVDSQTGFLTLGLLPAADMLCQDTALHGVYCYSQRYLEMGNARI